MKTTVFVGASVDGFIARANDDIDWLPPGGGEEHGYQALMDAVDAVVIGRRTFDKVLTFGAWPYGDKLVFVLTTRVAGLSVPQGARVEFLSGEPAEILAQLAHRGLEHLYIDGGLTIQRFLRAGLISRLVITRVPVLIGQGIPLFGPLEADVPLRHVRTRSLAGGMVQSEYEIGPGSSS